MPVNYTPSLAQDLLPVSGLSIGITQAGIRKVGRKDLTVFLLDEGSSVGAVFTQNKFCAAPVQVSHIHLAATTAIRALVINTGNANAGTGLDGRARHRLPHRLRQHRGLPRVGSQPAHPHAGGRQGSRGRALLLFVVGLHLPRLQPDRPGEFHSPEGGATGCDVPHQHSHDV